MAEKWNLDNVELDFLQENTQDNQNKPEKTYKVIIADDDNEVHSVTKVMLSDFTFEGRKLEFIDTYSGAETMRALEVNSDVAVLFLDVVMEDVHSGFEVVKYLREILCNQLTRVILRTGQPGEAPESKVIREYDINDYRLKTEMTVQRLNTSLLTALRNYRDLYKIERHRKGLQKIIKASGILFKHNSIDEFFMSILSQLGTLEEDDAELVYMRDNNEANEGFITVFNQAKPTIVAATDKYKEHVGRDLKDINELSDIYTWVKEHENDFECIEYLSSGLIIKNDSRSSLNNYIFIESKEKRFDLDLIKLFMNNYSSALDNYVLNKMVLDTQVEVINVFGKVIEQHFDETSSHVDRICEMMYQFALLNNFSYKESEMLKIASTMHDIGKIGIPDAILKKPGKLNDEEFETVKKHTLIGHQVLCQSELDIFKTASEIALYHHEKYDGNGYPKGLSGKSIPISARMLAIVDVYDAITSKRCYKEAESKEEGIRYILDNRGKHFDPQLAELFVQNIDIITHQTKRK